MLFSPIDIVKELRRQRSENPDLRDAAQRILDEEAEKEARIRYRLTSYDKNELVIDPAQFDQDLIFTEKQIKSICVDFRLRLLDSKLYNPEIPYEAIQKTKYAVDQFPELDGAPLKMMAPASCFELSDANADPVLFAALGKKNYLLIHKWGNDLSWTRRLRALPFKSLENMLLTIACCSMLFCLSLPYDVFMLPGGQSSFYIRGWLFFHSYIGFCGFAAFYCFAYNKNLSGASWDSKHFNQ